MTFTKWILLLLFVLGFLYFIEPIARYHCPVALVFVILGGIYMLWTGRMVFSYGTEYEGPWAYVFGILAIALGLFVLIAYCPTTIPP